MPRWTRDRSLETLPRARDFVTPGGYRVPVALRWLLLVEYAQRYGFSLEDLLRALGIPKGATAPERRRRMRLVTAEELLEVELWVQQEVDRWRPKGSTPPLADPCRAATGGADAEA